MTNQAMNDDHLTQQEQEALIERCRDTVRKAMNCVRLAEAKAEKAEKAMREQTERRIQAEKELQEYVEGATN